MHAEEAIRRCEKILSDAKRDGTVRAGSLGVLGVLFAMRGRFAEAREVEMGEKQDIPGTANRLADALCRQGRFEEAAQWVEIGSGRGIRALLAARRGEFEQAKRLARELVAMTERGQNLNARGTALVRLAEVLSIAGRPGEAVAALNEAIQLYERKGNLVSAREARALLEKLSS